MAALRALAQFRAHWAGVESVAADAVKRGLAALEFKAPVIAPVVPQPEAEKDRCDQHSVN